MHRLLASLALVILRGNLPAQEIGYYDHDALVLSIYQSGLNQFQDSIISDEIRAFEHYLQICNEKMNNYVNSCASREQLAKKEEEIVAYQEALVALDDHLYAAATRANRQTRLWLDTLFQEIAVPHKAYLVEKKAILYADPKKDFTDQFQQLLAEEGTSRLAADKWLQYFTAQMEKADSLVIILNDEREKVYPNEYATKIGLMDFYNSNTQSFFHQGIYYVPEEIEHERAHENTVKYRHRPRSLNLEYFDVQRRQWFLLTSIIPEPPFIITKPKPKIRF